jgi:hypothetical protein
MAQFCRMNEKFMPFAVITELAEILPKQEVAPVATPETAESIGGVPRATRFK